MLGFHDPEIMGWYTALINLSDIAACGGIPKGMLVSLEMPANHRVSDLERFYVGLMSALRKYNTPLLGGNLKASTKFSATGTILGQSGARPITRRISAKECQVFLVGRCGEFWASVISHHQSMLNTSPAIKSSLFNALAFPAAQLEAGRALSSVSFEVACMDCSDGPANALYQLAAVNELELTLRDHPPWNMTKHAVEILSHAGIEIDNACYHFGDWQLAVLVPENDVNDFLNAMKDFPLTCMGHAAKGVGRVKTCDGRVLVRDSLNENFRRGYNSMNNVDELINRYMREPVFE